MPPQRNPTQRPPLETARAIESHPSRGGTRGYSQDMRRAAIEHHQLAGAHDPSIQQLQANHDYPSNRSIHRWRRREAAEGHYLPYMMNGNRPAWAMSGHSLLMLVYFRMCYPKATAAELNAFLFNTLLPGMEPRFWTDSQITEAEQWLGLSRKRGSTTAYQAGFAINIAKRNVFWNTPYPTGIQGTSASTIIDFDEAALFIETCDRSYGKCFLSSRVREEGPYNHSQKYTITAAIWGGNNGGCWVHFSDNAGTTALDTHDFLDMIINGNATTAGIGHAPAALPMQTFICDNLTAHHDPLVAALVNHSGHHLCFRAPYNPWDGPIEYFFNYLQCELSLALYRVRTPQDLEQEVYNIAQRSGGNFARYFAHCGYAP